MMVRSHSRVCHPVDFTVTSKPDRGARQPGNASYGPAKRRGFLLVSLPTVSRSRLIGLKPGSGGRLVPRCPSCVGFAPHHRVQISGPGPLFTQLVVEAFNREGITASDVSDFLSIRVKHLPEIERDLLRRPA